jgi:glycosyltransferase involved in cell wall biosynthesis
LARGFDVLHLEPLWAGWVGLEYAERALLHIHYLYCFDLAQKVAGSIVERARRIATRRAERELLRSYPTISTLTPRSTACVEAINPGPRVHTAPFGIDLALYPFEPGRTATGPPVVGLIESFRWEPTYSAGLRLLERLWPAIKKRAPVARLQIVGRSARAALGERAKGADITIDEDVPDIVPYFRGRDVLLYAPAPASGMNVKVIEEFALGVPVVTTAEGVEGLPADDGVHAGICEDDRGFVDRALELMRNSAQAERQRLAARQLIEACCGPGPTVRRIEEIDAQLKIG